MNNFDLTILIIVAFLAFVGYIRGFFLSLVNLIKYILAVIGTKILSPFVILFLWESSLRENLFHFVSQKLTTLNLETYFFSNSSLDSSSSKIPLFENLFESHLLKAENSFSEFFTKMFISAIGTLITFLALLFVLTIFTNIINRTIKKSKILNASNKFLGLLFGLLTSVLIIIIILVVFAPLIYTYSLNDTIANSKILNFFYNSNLYIKILSDWTKYIPAIIK